MFDRVTKRARGVLTSDLHGSLARTKSHVQELARPDAPLGSARTRPDWVSSRNNGDFQCEWSINVVSRETYSKCPGGK
jgi:hypothetical protein